MVNILIQFYIIPDIQLSDEIIIPNKTTVLRVSFYPRAHHADRSSYIQMIVYKGAMIWSIKCE